MLVKESIDLLKSKSEKEIDDEIHARIGDKKYNLFLKFKKDIRKRWGKSNRTLVKGPK